MIQQGLNYSQHCNQSGVSISTNLYLQKLCYMFSIYNNTQIYIIIVKVITIKAAGTSFAYLKISTVRFKDNVQRLMFHLP